MNESLVFVTIGHVESKKAVVKKIPMRVVGKGTVKDRAKKMRQHYIKHPWLLGFPKQITGFKTEELFWAIYDNFEDKKPVESSESFFYWVGNQ